LPIFNNIGINGNPRLFIKSCQFITRGGNELIASISVLVLLKTKSCMQEAISQLLMFNQWVFGKFFTSKKCDNLFMLSKLVMGLSFN
jgi:hypothetical protein